MTELTGPAELTSPSVSDAHEAVVNEIIAAAIAEFSARGYERTNLGEVAKHVGVTRQALYHYFPRKHDMLQAVLTDYMDELESAVEAPAQLDDPAEQFRGMVRAHCEIVARNPVLSRIFVHDEASLPADLRATFIDRRRAYQQRFETAYGDAVAKGTFRPVNPKLATLIVLGAANWMYRWFRSDGELDPSAMAEVAEGLLFGGYGAQRPTGVAHVADRTVD